MSVGLPLRIFFRKKGGGGGLELFGVSALIPTNTVFHSSS